MSLTHKGLMDSFKYQPRILFLISLVLIWIIFTIFAIITYKQFNQDVIKKEFENQQRTAQIINEVLQRYFDTLRFITQNAAIQPAFKSTSLQVDEHLLNQTISATQAQKLIVREGITHILTNPKAHPLIKIPAEKKQEIYQDILNTYFSKQAKERAADKIAQNNIKADKRIQGNIQKEQANTSELIPIQNRIEQLEKRAKQQSLASKELKERDDLYRKIQSAEVKPENWPILNKNIAYLKEIRRYYKSLDLIYYPKIVLNINSKKAHRLLHQDIQVWQLTKGLPYTDIYGRAIAAKRRALARSMLETYPDLYNIFQVTADGKILFLEPYSMQKNSTEFDLGNQYYLNLIEDYEKTFASEVYQSLSSDKTQIISIASPVFNSKNEFTSMVGASIAVATLQKQIFSKLLQDKIISKGTNIFLIDHYGHVVASSSGQHIYTHERNQINDLNDQGNFRRSPILKSIKFVPAVVSMGMVNLSSWHGIYHGHRLLQSIYQEQYKNLDNIEVIGTFLPISLDGIKLNWGILIETPLAQVLATSIYLKHIFLMGGSILALVLIAVFTMTLKNFTKLEALILRKEKEVESMASQTAHDIRSPLVALDTLIDSLKHIDEERRLAIRYSLNRIKDIANNLLSQYKIKSRSNKALANTSAELIAFLIDNVISEKRIQYAQKDISFIKEWYEEDYASFATIHRTDFSRALSNLIDNAIEAMTGKGIIVIKLIRQGDFLKLSVIDNGCGIPAPMIPKILKGQQSAKKSGTGLGLAYAIRCCEAWGGKLEIKSELGKGTTVEMFLPRCQPAEGFVPRLRIKQESIIVIVDNDESIHNSWKQRFQSVLSSGDNIKIYYFSTAQELLIWHDPLLDAAILYLVDYELIHDQMTGIEVIERLGISEQAILVTSWYEDEAIKEKCRSLKLKSIPKHYIPYIPIEVICIKPDLILIDDNIAITSSWKMLGEKAGKKVAIFNSMNEFMQLIEEYPKTIPIYIDSDLNETLKGEVFAKSLFEKGYSELYLATGYDRSYFREMPWIKKVVGKEPPFGIHKES